MTTPEPLVTCVALPRVLSALSVAELLLSAGADPKAGQEDGHSALWCLDHTEKLSDRDRKRLRDLFAGR